MTESNEQAGSPRVVLITGPNGAGKSTLAPVLLRDTVEIHNFVNADTIAAGLSAFEPETTALEAGRIMLCRLHELAQRNESFAFETTLATRSYAPWLSSLRMQGYRIHLFFLWLSDPELAVLRVQERVRLGGHGVPQEVIRRRYRAGLSNFFNLYRPVPDSWRYYDNSRTEHPLLVAAGLSDRDLTVYNQAVWERITESAL
jgi:predicted ABC-type ATPase